MKKYLIVFFFSFISVAGIGQNTEYHDFTGFILTSDAQKISFKLLLKDFKNGDFKGYSITNFDGEDYTKSGIEGNIDLYNKKMSFRETVNVDTKSDAEESIFCYISSDELRIEVLNNKNIIAGEFRGLFPSGEECAKGVVILQNGEDLENLGKLETTEDIPISLEEAIKDKSGIKDSVFTANETMNINTWRNEVQLEVWDGYFEDQDQVAIYVNGKLINDKVELKNKKTIISLPGNTKNFKLKIVALNEGSSGVNTLNFRVINSGNDKEYISMLKKGESFSIDFNKE